MTIKLKRKNPCWHCSDGQGHYDKAMSDGSPFRLLKCDTCGAWWENSEFFGITMRILPTFKDRLRYFKFRVESFIESIL